MRELSAVLGDVIDDYAYWSTDQVSRIRDELHNNRPVVVQFEQGTGSLHYALITGIAGQGVATTFAISDPIRGEFTADISHMNEDRAQILLWVAP